MKKQRLLLLLLLASGSLAAQKAVLLHRTNGTQQAFYSNDPFNEAYNAAAKGDTIYLPGGTFNPLNIDKGIKIYGAGHYPDSTQATGQTIINGTIGCYYSDADSLLIEGLYIKGHLHIRGLENVYVKVKRNRIDGNLEAHSPYGQYDGNLVIGITFGPSTANTAFLTNNIFQGPIAGFGNGTIFRNNIFLAQSDVLYSPGNTYVNFENNIFVSSNASWNYNNYSIHNTFTKNVFAGSPDFTGNTATGNYFNVSGIFVSQSGFTFSYNDNYHLQNPGTYPGVDGTQCGIYGGLFVYKEGGVPANPHIISKTISGTTDASGKLNATIKVAAQNH